MLDKPGTVQLQHLQPLAMVQINGAADAEILHVALSTFELERAPVPLQCVSGTQIRLLWNGPGRYLAVSGSLQPRELCASLASALRAGDASCVDLSHASCVLRVQGPSAQEVIAKGCALDLELMSAQACMPTAIGRFDVLLHCVSEDTFELYVARSLAQSFARWLLRAAAEFGVSVLE
jgi:sarcosine oxidase subunit gamma